MNKLKLILFTLLLFILLNAIIVFLWPIKTNLKFAEFNPYSEEYSKSLNLKKEEVLNLYLETWQRERLFEYDQYTGIRESESINGKYVNISKENGRLVPNNPEICKKNIFFYGGEFVFGYDVTDSQSIPFYFRDILKNKDLEYCVYNYGRATYFSTQENILFQQHIINNKIKKNDEIIFIDGDNEIGMNELLNTKFIEENYNSLHQKYWKLYRVGIKYFFNLLPITQLYEVLLNKNKNQNNDDLKESNQQLEFESILNVYERNLSIRSAICEKYNYNCYNFLFFHDDKMKKNFQNININNNLFKLNDQKKNLLKNEFDSFSPESNKILAKEIYDIILIN